MPSGLVRRSRAAACGSNRSAGGSSTPGRSFEQMSDVPKALRTSWSSRLPPRDPDERHLQAADDTHSSWCARRRSVRRMRLDQEPRDGRPASARKSVADGLCLCASGLNGVVSPTAGETSNNSSAVEPDPRGRPALAHRRDGDGRALANLDSLLEARSSPVARTARSGEAHYNLNGRPPGEIAGLRTWASKFTCRLPPRPNDLPGPDRPTNDKTGSTRSRPRTTSRETGRQVTYEYVLSAG